MQTVLVVIFRSRPLDHALLAAIRLAAAKWLPFAGAVLGEVAWVSASSRVGLFVWSNEPHGHERAFAQESDREVALAISGYVGSGEGSGASDLLARLGQARDRRPAVAQLPGVWTAWLADGRRDEVTVWNTVTRVEPVYWSEGPGLTVVGTRALLVHLIATGRDRPDYDLGSLPSFLCAGFFADETTPFRGVRVLPANSELRVDGSKAIVDAIDDSLARSTSGEPAFDEIAETLVRACRPLALLPGAVSCNLTGGKDSRLVAAALRRAGVSFVAATGGHESNPDVQIGRRVAETLRVAHSVVTPRLERSAGEEVVRVDLSSRACDGLFATDGMLSAYENASTSRQFDPSKVTLGGHGGELLRGGYAKNVKGRDLEAVLRFFESAFLGTEPYLRPDVAGSYRQFLQGWVALQPAGTEPVELLDRFYLLYRCGRWSAAGRAAYSRSRRLVQPLFDNALVKLVQRVPCRVRADDRLVHAMLEHLAPELIDVPLAGDGWKLQERVAPVRPRPALPEVGDWRRPIAGDLRAAMREQVFGSDAQALFDVLRLDRVKALLTKGESVSEVGLAWRIFTASVLLSDRWLAEERDRRIVEVPVRPVSNAAPAEGASPVRRAVRTLLRRR